MSTVEVKCKNCSHEFSLEFYNFNLTIRCPNCARFGMVSGFTPAFDCHPTWSSGYELDLAAFEYLLKFGGKYALKSFFKKHLDLSFTRRKSGAIYFRDASNNAVSIAEVHALIQKDWFLQRLIYNLDFATFR